MKIRKWLPSLCVVVIGSVLLACGGSDEKVFELGSTSYSRDTSELQIFWSDTYNDSKVWTFTIVPIQCLNDSTAGASLQSFSLSEGDQLLRQDGDGNMHATLPVSLKFDCQWDITLSAGNRSARDTLSTSQ